MTRNTTRRRHQKAVYWAYSYSDDDGEPVVSTGVELDVRWVEKQTEGADAKGNVQTYAATVVLDQDVTHESIMWLGAVKDLTDPVTDVTDLFIVKDFSKTPDIKGRKYRRTARLQRFGNTLPTIG